MLDWLDANFATDLGGLSSSDAPLVGVTPLPHVQAYGFAGSRDELEDRPTIEVQVFAASYMVAGNLAEAIDAKLLTPGGHRIASNGGFVLFDQVLSITSPVEVPWDAEGVIRRFQASYSVSIRR